MAQIGTFTCSDDGAFTGTIRTLNINVQATIRPVAKDNERGPDYRVAGLNETANYELPILLETTPQPTIKIRKRDRERAERIRLAGGPKPSLRERAVALARERGEVRTCDLTDIGIPRCYLARMCDEGLLIKVGYGIYRATDQETARSDLGQFPENGNVCSGSIARVEALARNRRRGHDIHVGSMMGGTD